MLYLIDASVYVFRAYYSMPPDMLDREGNAAHALFGFARFLGDLIERAKPRYLAVAFDESLETSFRNRIDPTYKANREPAPADLKLQFGRCREFCEHLGVAHFGSGEYEADDIIGTLHARFRREGLPATLVTRDKDLAQLVREGDVYWNYTDNLRLQHHEIEGHFGVAPERYADYLALTGDAVDNIKGVPGVGPKTAAVLLKDGGTYRAFERACTHQGTSVDWQAGSGDFLCSNHGARFSAEGGVTMGPANSPLRAIEVSVAADGTVTYRR